MLIVLLRHGAPAYNAENRYQGRTDIPLSSAGREALHPADFAPETVYVSPLSRAAETAAILFPGTAQIPVPALAEMDFGTFEGRTWREMAHDPDYRVWVENGCAGRCPGGESRGEFSARACGAFAQLVDQGLASGAEYLVIVAHGGTQMAVLERFALPPRGYFDWKAPCGGGFLLDAAPWRWRRRLELIKEVRFTRD